MRAFFFKFTIFHDKNVVSFLDGGQSMSDDDSGDRAKLFFDLIDGFLNYFFILFVEGASSFIQK